MDNTLGTKQIHIKLDSETHQALKLDAAFNNLTIQELVVQIIQKRILENRITIQRDNKI